MATIETSNTGIVKFFNGVRNYGFIIDHTDLNLDGSAKEYFFHSSGTLDLVEKEDEVAYDLETGGRGVKAVNVKRIKKEDNS